MKSVSREFAPSYEILKYFDYKGAACVISQDFVTEADENGYLIAKAGTPYPSDDSNCLGYLLHDVDVTNGDNAGTYIFEGSIDNAKLEENGVSVSDLAKAATPRVSFFD